MLFVLCFCFFFFKQKTAYEMRISDWSSDVCSSDLAGGFARGYRALIAHLRAAEAKADAVDGVWKLPDGQTYYEAQLEAYTTLPLKAADVHALGLREVAALHADMHAIMKRTGFEGGPQDFFTVVTTDPCFYYPAR